MWLTVYPTSALILFVIELASPLLIVSIHIRAATAVDLGIKVNAWCNIILPTFIKFFLPRVERTRPARDKMDQAPCFSSAQLSCGLLLPLNLALY